MSSGLQLPADQPQKVPFFVERPHQLYSFLLKVIPDHVAGIIQVISIWWPISAYGFLLGSFMSVFIDLKMYMTMINKSRSMTFIIPDISKKHLKSFLKWKKDRNEPIGKDDFLFIGQRGVMTVRAI
jgi:hypothetical protein